MVTLARMWMKFVQSHYSQGKGSKPRWAIAGLEFMLCVCNPYNTKFLKEDDFQVMLVYTVVSFPHYDAKYIGKCYVWNFMA